MVRISCRFFTLRCNRARADFFIQPHETVTGNHTQRDFVGKLFSLEIWMVREHPHVAELVSDSGLQFFVGQTCQKRGILSL